MRGFLSGYLAQFRGFHPDARRFILYSLTATFAQSVYGLVFNLYVLELGYDREFLGTLESLPAFVIAALAVPAAILLARVPLKRTLLAGAAIGFVTAAGAAFFPSKPLLLAFRFLAGVGGSLGSVAALPLLARCCPEKDRNALFSFQFSFSMIASFAGSLLGGQLTSLAARLLSGGAESAAAYRFTLAVSVALLALSFIPLARLKEDPQGEGESAFDLSRLNLPKLGWVLAPQVIIGLGAGMVIPYLNLFFKTSFPMSIGKLGFVMALMPLSMAFGGLIGPWFVKRMGHVPAMIFFQSMSIPFLATVGFSGVLWATVLAAFLRTMLMNASWPLYSVFMLGNFDKGLHPVVSAFYAMSWNLLWSLGTKVSGTLQMDFGWNMPFLGTIICYSVATLILSRKFGREKAWRLPPARPDPLAAPRE